MEKKTVLLVDDEFEVLEGLKRALRKEPYEILTATSGEHALDILRSQDVHVVVSDEKMPSMKGSEFLAQARKEYPDTIRIMLTGNASVDSAMRAIHDGYVYQYLHKPCKAADLASAIYNGLLLKSLLMKNEDPHVRMSSEQQQELLETVTGKAQSTDSD